MGLGNVVNGLIPTSVFSGADISFSVDDKDIVVSDIIAFSGLGEQISSNLIMGHGSTPIGHSDGSRIPNLMVIEMWADTWKRAMGADDGILLRLISGDLLPTWTFSLYLKNGPSGRSSWSWTCNKCRFIGWTMDGDITSPDPIRIISQWQPLSVGKGGKSSPLNLIT